MDKKVEDSPGISTDVPTVGQPTIVTTAPSGGVVRPLYQERAMKCFLVTDSELKSLSLANGLMVVFFSLASALVGFGLDISKDLVLTPDVPAGARAMAEMTRQACFYFAGAFALAGVGTYLWRRSALDLIRRESGDTSSKRWVAQLGDLLKRKG